MSKEAALRAMREARYAERSRSAPASKPTGPAVRPVVSKASKAETAVTVTESADSLCGHRSMNGRACTREAGHAAKSHRYS